MTRRELLAFD
jgi:hypothetical protein